MFSHLKRRIGVLTAVAVLAALVPTLAVSTASAAPATALVPYTNVDSADYSACPTGSAAAAGFTDTTSTDVDCIALYGITTGVTATTYEPTASVPRWQMALYLTRTASKAGITLGSGADQGFTDITGKSAEIQTAINQLKQLGVTNGTTATTYSPDDNVTREQMAMFLERLLAMTPFGAGGQNDSVSNLTLYVNSTDIGTGKYNYDDIDSGSVTFEGHNAIVEMYQLGVTGDATTVRTFNPAGEITRATMATWLTNALGHTNVRPAGLWLQSVKYSGFANTALTLSASYRDSDQVPVANKVIDFFEWVNATTAGNDAAMTAAGACNANVAVTTNSMTKCKVEVGDPTTDTKGNVTFGEAVGSTATNSYFAWTAAAGTTFANATHGSGTDYSTINVSSTAAATDLALSVDLKSGAEVTDTGATDRTTVKYGDSYTITAQASKALVGTAYPAVAQPLVAVTFTHTIYAVGTNNIESVATTIVKTDANGTATYTVTDADPSTALLDATRHGVVVSSAITERSVAADNAPGFFVGGNTMELSFDDAVVAATSSSMATNVTSYAAGSALLPVARSATMSILDQYGDAHIASAGTSVQFTGASIGRLADTTFGDDSVTFAAAPGLDLGDKFVITELGADPRTLIEDCTYTVKTRTSDVAMIIETVAGDPGVGNAGCIAASPFDITVGDISGDGAGAWLVNRINDTFGIADRTVGADGTANIAWNDVTATAGLSQAGGYVSAALNQSPNKTAHRYLAPSAVVLDNAQTSAIWTETSAGADNLADADDDIVGQILAWDNTNNTLLVQLDYATGACSKGALLAAAGCPFTITQYSYDDNDQFSLTADVTSAATTLAGFEVQLTAHLNAATAGVFAAGDLDTVTYQALAANVSIFGLGT